MKLTDWFINFDFSGRARRSHMWKNLFAYVAIWIVLLTLIAAASGGETAGAGPTPLLALVALAVLVISAIDGIAMTFRRAHDTNRSGWIWLLGLIPFVNLLAFYWLYIEDSQQGPNKYGPAVKEFYVPPIVAASGEGLRL